MKPYVLADDLSGALEAGAAFRAAGWRVVLPLEEGGTESDALRVLSTETRNRTTEEARSEVERILRAEHAAGSRLLFKKIDSTLRGPLGGEFAAVREFAHPRLTALCPANPVAGRTIRDGILRVHGVPLTATDFAFDPYWPAKSSSVSTILKGHGIENVTTMRLSDLRLGADRAGEWLARIAAGAPAIVVPDIELQSDVALFAKAAHLAQADLFVGGGTFADEVSQLIPVTAAAPRSPAPPEFRFLLVLCGSRHSTSHHQIDVLARRSKAVVLDQSPGALDVVSVADRVMDALQTSHAAAVRFKVSRAAPTKAAKAVIEDIAALARELERRDGLANGLMLLTGGETARAVCRALQGQRLEVLAEVERGVVVASLELPNGKQRFIMSKPGGFGSEHLLAKLRELVK